MAIEQQVDIISIISWAVKKQSSDLEEAIRKAVKSTKDFSLPAHRRHRVSPTSMCILQITRDVTAVSASNRFGWQDLNRAAMSISCSVRRNQKPTDRSVDTQPRIAAYPAHRSQPPSQQDFASLCLFRAYGKPATATAGFQAFQNRIAMPMPSGSCKAATIVSLCQRSF